MGAPWRGHPSWELVERLSDAAGRDLEGLLLKASPEVLRATHNAQLATFAFSLVVLDAALHGPLAGVPPKAWSGVAGHSLGEYSALVAAGAISAEEGGRLVQARAEAMQAAAEAHPGTMAAVIGLELAPLERLCEGTEGAWVANDNAPGQVVVAGTLAGVALAGERALAAGAKRVIPLQVGGAFHTPLMRPAEEGLEAALRRAGFGKPACPVVANVDAAAHWDGFPALLSAQLCSRVRWRESLATLAGSGGKLFVELGPGTELSGMVRRTLPEVARANVATPADLAGLESALSALLAG
jgi:[acyl-carrier-protein] S-malonyltransferase